MENQKKIDRVILSSDLNPQFLNFWPIAAQSWKKVFGLLPTLALVTREPIDLLILERLEEFGPVYSYLSKSEAPLPNQAKMARWYLAGKLNNELVTIEDIDTMFLTNEYLLEKLSYFQDGTLLGIGNDVNQENSAYKGKFPASNLTGRSETFSAFFGSNATESFEEFLNRFKGMVKIDNREDPFSKPKNFSDESLIRALRAINKDDLVKTIPRNVDIQNVWMDRSWWPDNGEIPENAILANLPRPLYNNQQRCRKLIQLYFQEGYPWMIERKSRIWENPDHPVRIMFATLSVVIRHKLEKKFRK